MKIFLPDRFTKVGAVLLAALLVQPGILSGAQALRGKSDRAEATKNEQLRAEALRKLCQRAGIGPGDAVADIGCGGGVDTVTFAEMVGPTGNIYAEEVSPSALTNMIRKVRGLKLDQVVPVLGQSADPCLPPGAVDLVYMHLVFHHFAHPREMLHKLWLGLKPGGWLVIIDREKGPLKVWVEDETREKEHKWTSETAVVRLARESGFLFEAALEDIWFEKEPFVLMFRKSAQPMAPLAEPDPLLPLKTDTLVRRMARPKGQHAKLAFVGLDQSRVLLPAMQKRLGSQGTIYDVVLEEWATSTNEIPPTAPGVQVEVLRTVGGKLPSSADDLTFSAVVFADAYHRIWEPVKLLEQLRGKLAKGGRVVVLDRKGPVGEPRRVAGHRRRISPGLVREDFECAGFRPMREVKTPAPDRFLLLFRLAKGKID